MLFVLIYEPPDSSCFICLALKDFPQLIDQEEGDMIDEKHVVAYKKGQTPDQM